MGPIVKILSEFEMKYFSWYLFRYLELTILDPWVLVCFFHFCVVATIIRWLN
jgi:hypothetical protein